jgi:hypothetical protein
VTDPDLMRGEGWVRCCVCGELHTHPYPNLARDKNDGALWDVCICQCAIDAGLEQ